jgi:hypothetical protein
MQTQPQHIKSPNKRKYLLLLFFCLFFVSAKISAQDIQQKLNNLKNKITLALDSCRTNTNLGYLSYGLLNWYLLDNPIDTKKEKELYDIQLNWAMVYDDKMIERIIKLLNNEYREDELETLVDRQMAIFSQNLGFEQRAARKMMVDTSKIFIFVQDSLNKYRDKEIHLELYQNFEVFKYMQLDTTPLFFSVLNNVIKTTREETVNYFLNQYHFDIAALIKTCGYINDKRLVKPLINLLEKLIKKNKELEALLIKNEDIEENEDIANWLNKKNENEILIEYIRFTLVRLKVEPYYLDFFKSISQSIEEIKKMNLVTEIQTFSKVLHNQESFLELSKYLHSSAYTGATGDGYYGIAYEDAYREIKKYIENKGLWNIINKPDFNLETDRFKIYDWMQKNYGKYKIKRIW